MKVYWLFLQLLLSLVIKLLLWNQCSALIKSIYYQKIRLLFIFRTLSFSFIMSATVQYMIFMLASKFLRSLHFDEHNITNFFKHFEKQCDKYEIIEKKRWIKFFYYCVKFIAEFMTIFSSYVDRSWEAFEKKMQKEYKDQNIEQMINSRLFLKKFKNKVRKNNQMRIYSRHFKNILIKLIKWRQLNIYTQCSWYL